MGHYLNTENFLCATVEEKQALTSALEIIIANDFKGEILPMLAGYRKILEDDRRREEWDGIHEKLMTLFKCGKSTLLDGPMIGVPISIRDSDYFKETAKKYGHSRSMRAHIEWMATLWNAAYANTGLWMGKTFEPVSREVFAAKCGNNPAMMERYDPTVTRIGRDFFREPHRPNFLQSLGLPVLTQFWELKDRPLDPGVPGFDSQLLSINLDKEKAIPYVKTGGIFLALPGNSVVEEMNGKAVYQLNYRWHELHPAFPMTRMVNELVQIDEGVCLGQLVMAAHHYSLGTLRLPLSGESPREWEVGEAYTGNMQVDYGYQNNGFFLMIDPSRARQVFADEAFPNLRPRPGEIGWKELGYDKSSSMKLVVPTSEGTD